MSTDPLEFQQAGDIAGKGDEMTFDEISALLFVDFENGKLYWKPRPIWMFPSERTCKAWNAQFAGTEAFTADSGSGYKRGSILGRSYLAHRVIWLLAYGVWPSDKIDHINGARSDNRLFNLRDVSNTENCRNSRISVNNKSGVTGVFWRRSHAKWGAKIRVGRVSHHLGYFDVFEDAVSARKSAEICFNFHPNHGRAA